MIFLYVLFKIFIFIITLLYYLRLYKKYNNNIFMFPYYIFLDYRFPCIYTYPFIPYTIHIFIYPSKSVVSNVWSVHLSQIVRCIEILFFSLTHINFLIWKNFELKIKVINNVARCTWQTCQILLHVINAVCFEQQRRHSIRCKYEL